MSQSPHHRQVTVYLQAMRRPQPCGSEALRTGGQDHGGLHTADGACLPSDIAAILTFCFHFHQLFLTFLVPSKKWIYTISLQEVHLHSTVLRATMTVFFPAFSARISGVLQEVPPRDPLQFTSAEWPSDFFAQASPTERGLWGSEAEHHG